jgi:hypothetical protein
MSPTRTVPYRQSWALNVANNAGTVTSFKHSNPPDENLMAA